MAAVAFLSIAKHLAKNKNKQKKNLKKCCLAATVGF